jgi:NhaA family Na+:H+ antiporter
MLCGIGLTMSLFIGALAFDAGLHGSAIQAEVKLAVLTGSVVSAGLGLAWLALTAARRPQG